MTIITLLTDFGLRDGYPGIMKGVIYQIAPGVQIVDISHLVQPQNIREGSLLLKRAYPYFPEGTIHVMVVDPGVGTIRRPIAARLGKQCYVCPDNGLITHPLVEAENENLPVDMVHLDRPEFWLPEVSNVFHGRDIFSPVAAHLARGVPLHELGSQISDPIRLQPPQPSPISNGWRGEITAIDHFGNLSTNFSPYHLTTLQNPHVRLAGQTINGLVRTFGEKPPGTLVAFIDSDGFMAVAVVNGSAAQELGAEIGAPVEVTELT